MQLFGYDFIVKKSYPLPESIDTDKQIESFFYPLNFAGYTGNYSTVESQCLAYFKCPPLASVILKKANYTANGRIYFTDKQGNEIDNSQTKEIKKLLSNPNPLMNYSQLITTIKIYQQMFGICYLYKIKPINKVVGLVPIPNWLITPNYSSKYIYATDYKDYVIDYTVQGLEKNIPVEEMIVIRDFTVKIKENPVLPASRMETIAIDIDNVSVSKEALNTLIERKGALGILSNGDSGNNSGMLLPDVKEKLQDDFKRYGLSKNLRQVIITSANLKWQSMTFPTRDLMLFETNEESVRSIFDTYGIDVMLGGFKTNASYNNRTEAEKSAYQNTIIPEANDIFESLTFGLLGKDSSINIVVDYSFLPCLQTSKQENAASFLTYNQSFEILLRNNVITLQEWQNYYNANKPD